jgi:hypothetical protein
MTDCSAESATIWDKVPDHRLPDTYAKCKLVEGPDAALNSLAYVDIPSTVLDLPKNDVRPDILERNRSVR